MQDHSLLSTLSLVTLVIVVGIGVWMFLQNRNSQRKRGENTTKPSDLVS